MLKVGLLGGGFHHAHSSTWWKHPKYFEFDKGHVQDITFIIDDEIARNINLDCKRKIGWIVESRVIIPQAIKEFKAHYKEISESYEYVFTHYKDIYDLAPNFIYLPPHGYWIEEPKIYPKTKLVSMTSSTKRLGPGHDFRLNWVEKLKGKVDLYGMGFKNMVKKEEALCDYMFSVTIENDQYETYWTEKILDCFVSGTIPVYHGAPDLANYFNMDGIITLKDDFDPSMLSEELYHSMREPMMDNFERALNFDVIEDIIYEKYIKDSK
jgi:hypothetical protein